MIDLLDSMPGSVSGLVLAMLFSLAYVHGLRETFLAIRSIRFPRIRFRLPDWFKRDAQSLARLHPMDRTFSDACDW